MQYHFELAKWAPQCRRKMLEGTIKDLAKLAKRRRPPRLSMRDPRFKPGVQQVWYDVAGNRSIALLYWDHAFEPKDYIAEWKPSFLEGGDFQVFNVMETNDVLAGAGMADHSLDVNTLPRLMVEIVCWPPENRKETLKSIAGLVKKFGTPPLSIHNPDCNPNMVPILWDMLSNRSFAVSYDNPSFATCEGILDVYKQRLNMANVELVPVMEIADVLKHTGLL